MMIDFDLYPMISPTDDYEAVLNHLPKILIEPRISALLLCIDKVPSETIIGKLLSLSQQHNVALMVSFTAYSKPDSQRFKDVDGVHITDLANLPLSVQSAKSLKQQIGCSCTTLDEAMYAGEVGVDYVSFPAHSLELIEKWSGFAELPCVAENADSPHEAFEAVKRGADFVAFSLSMNETDLEWINELNTLGSL
ncbi:hypothetical protein GT348_05605 [Aristophania vespae]|uniref:Uncharacterized protein n=1 Tax=Aristophania vespae TaxID=2697033 RepID=A0A6P1NLP7_9PROT|nr:thiamine phosphate synthase [Aristophania vespae]QHI95791.1 hypothetical protein GT348_05605 [Aristophania vespae]